MVLFPTVRDFIARRVEPAQSGLESARRQLETDAAFGAMFRSALWATVPSAFGGIDLGAFLPYSVNAEAVDAVPFEIERLGILDAHVIDDDTLLLTCRCRIDIDIMAMVTPAIASILERDGFVRVGDKPGDNLVVEERHFAVDADFDVAYRPDDPAILSVELASLKALARRPKKRR